MRTKHFILILCCVVITTIIFIVLGPAGEPNDSLKSIVSQTHQQIRELQENLGVSTEQKTLEIDPKYLAILGFITDLPAKDAQYNDYVTINREKASQTQKQQQQQQQQQQAVQNAEIEVVPIEAQHMPLQKAVDANVNANDVQSAKSASKRPHSIPRVTTTPYNATKCNFTIVTYVQDGQGASAILLAQNVALKFPNEYLLIYDLGLSEEESRAVNAYCNSSKCTIINYDLSVFPSYISDQRMHAYRPIVIKDALMRSKSILFAENFIRIRGTSRDLYDLQSKVMVSGVLGWTTSTAVSTLTHPKMFHYFETGADEFNFLRMVDLDTVLFTDSFFVTEKIMLPWIKCALTVECIDPIGAQSNGCKYNKKPQYRYSGCHGYDASAFNIVLGLTWHLDDSKYSLSSDKYNIFYKETLEQATKILENRRRNSSETSDRPFTEE